MPIYDINGNPIVIGGGEGITIKRNNAEMVKQFLDVARSYLNQSGMTYQDAQTIFDSASNIHGVDCRITRNLRLERSVGRSGEMIDDTLYDLCAFRRGLNLQERIRADVVDQAVVRFHLVILR